MTLVIMAAGMGSRFGGLKQVEPVGPNGEFIIDYSIYDAIKAGFTKVVFIIKEENYELFRDTIGKRIESKIEVEYAFQKIEDVPKTVKIPEDRVKPWGTSQAILATKNLVNEPFAIINADDFYGYEPFYKMKKFFDDVREKNEFAMIGYKVCNTMTLNGAVKRGICTRENDYLTNLTESSVENVNGKIIATPLFIKKDPFEIEKDTLVSMNFFGFSPYMYELLEDEIKIFFEENKDNLEKCEFLIPNSVFRRLKQNMIKVKVLDTDEKWFGVTYKKDKEDVVLAIKKMIEDGKYPKKLWD